MHSKTSKTRLPATVGVAAAITLALFTFGCGSSPVPNAQFAETQGEVSTAQANGAQEAPQASLYLKLSTDGLALAEEQMENGQNEEARFTLEKARADAMLATSLAQNAKVANEAAAAVERIQALEDARPKG